MSELSKYLVEELLKESENITDYVVVYSGRFQPFHKGHYATYEHLVKKFGKNNVFIGTSDKTDNQKSPFNFREKKIIMTKMFGIPSNKIVQVKNPYAPLEILKNYDENTTALITVVGEKDEQRLGGKYFTPYNGNVDAGYMDKGYVYTSPAQTNPISGTDVRKWLGSGETEERTKLFTKVYPKFDQRHQVVKVKVNLKQDMYQMAKKEY
jgi:cytidyltransferase-like protein